MKHKYIMADTFRKIICTLFLGLLSSVIMTVAAQVTGTVTEADGEPLIGVTVAVDGTKLATVTDIEGNFSINAQAGQTLKITYIGKKSENVKVVAGKTHYDIVMQDDDQLLSEVVVVGYGTMEKKRVTSAITSITSDDMMSGLGGATIATALQGKISGLTTTGNSSPNASNGYQLRGVASVNAGQGPLVVIDGVPGGDLRAINQEDIQSIDVLKDASAGAIYGTRAAAGVILVTTKRAKEGKTQVNYTCELSVESVRKHLDLLSSQEYVERGLGYDYGYDTDWYKELTRENPFSQRHVVTISGGSKDLQLYSSLLYSNQEGIVKGDGRKDYSGRINGRYRMWDGIAEISVKSQFRQADRDKRNGTYTFQKSIELNPTIPLYDPENPSDYNVNGIGMGGNSWNPVADIEYKDYSAKDQWFLGDATLKLNLFKGFSVQGTMGLDLRQYQYNLYYSQKHRESVTSSKRGKATHQFSKTLNKSFEAYANYVRDFGENYIDAVAGYSYYQNDGTEKFEMTNANFTVDGIGPWDMSAGTDLSDGQAAMSSNKSPRERLISFFARVNYTYADKYLATASYRREGSSKFGKNNRWGNFWSLSAGWRINREKFMEDVEWLNDLKVRVGYGVTGNNDFGSGYTVRTYKSNDMYPTNGIWQPGYGSTKNINPDLKWEEKKEFNVGIDFAVLDQRLSGKFDWYHRRVDDMLFEVAAPVPPMVYTTVMKNIGSLTNTGWEFELTGVPVQNNQFTWASTLRVSQNDSKIKNLGDSDSFMLPDAMPASMGYEHKLVNGSKIGQFWLFKTAGLDENGKWLIYDKDNNIVPAKDGSVNNLVDENKHWVGNAIPKVILSWENNLRYRDFDLGIQLRSWIDYDVFSELNLYHGLQSTSQENVLKIAYTDNAAINDTRITSDYFLSDASFLKIDAISLGYTLNLSKWNKFISRARFYVTVRDLCTWTKYKGYNPEVSINGLYPGVEYVRSSATMYPQTTRWTFGAQLTF